MYIVQCTCLYISASKKFHRIYVQSTGYGVQLICCVNYFYIFDHGFLHVAALAFHKHLLQVGWGGEGVIKQK